MVGCGHEEILYIVILNGGHSLDSLASAVLSLEVIDAHPLYIAESGHRYNGILMRNHLFIGDIIDIITEVCMSLITVFISSLSDFLLDHTQKKSFICKYRS